mmetsp:Transcript_4560/g.9816  ORF Transcript_4560/g.9816 Transcript_4560/m.9816 type:complete len:436 (-) Transcript_4560:771-2078(-)|eukprot:CAMPEP_0202894294 /NCGR_PEP_ID=MMETSP1392-20130828/3730_1 /ASSEMBLY_ACC=CAM_ASM_000868 /TAXON_ID=225041 /ORGANISM="Chlamydomonas chlamydogama, Strain SAG 11-48b" /LENGTH=435 /DNA_ID=CAMNT_0049578945 /DNA_START=124 /DNA_END=1431 /DNA_ORIENTATION=+
MDKDKKVPPDVEKQQPVNVAEVREPSTNNNLWSGINKYKVVILCFHLPKVIAELWRRIKMEVVVELPMLKQRWKILVFGIIMQYVHGIFTQLAHRMHKPQEVPLHDVGFDMTPELGPDKFWVSEAIFGTLFASFVIWTFTPFLTQRKRFYTVVMWSRLLMVLVVCQALRIITFSVTQLPGPSYHCRASEPTATRPWPEHWTGHIVVDVQRQATRSCGDLIFSSHTTFMLTGILAYNEYGSSTIIKIVAWVCGAIVSTLIIASRKHYTVDIVIAWYTVPLVFYMLYRRWTTRRPMSEFLGAMGEFDEPDPQDGDVESGQVIQDKPGTSSHMESKPLFSAPKERPSIAKQALELGGLINGEHAEGAGSSHGAGMHVGMAGGNGNSGGAGAKGQGTGGAMVRPRSLMALADSHHDEASRFEDRIGTSIMQRAAACRVS